jgi:hypothetical protein
MVLSFQNPRDPGNVALRAKIEEWLREAELLSAGERLLNLREESDQCGPNCPHAETLLRIGGVADDAVREYRISRPLVFVRRPDIQALRAGS